LESDFYFFCLFLSFNLTKTWQTTLLILTDPAFHWKQFLHVGKWCGHKICDNGQYQIVAPYKNSKFLNPKYIFVEDSKKSRGLIFFCHFFLTFFSMKYKNYVAFYIRSSQLWKKNSVWLGLTFIFKELQDTTICNWLLLES
jgi:hypothetical protein